MHLFRAPIVLCLLGLTGCQSGPPQPSDEQKLQLHTETALSYYQMNELDRAQDQVQRGLQIDEDNELLRMILGWTLQRRGATEDILAAEGVFRSLDVDDDFRAALGLAEALERKGVLFDEAARGIASGARYTDAPDPAARAAELAQDAQESWEESIRRYLRTLELRAGERQALNGLSRVTTLLGREQESLAWSEELINGVQEDIAFWKRQLEREDITSRQEANLRSLLIDNTNLEVRARLHAASLLRRQGQLEIAQTHLDRVADAAPDLPETHSRRAQNLFDLGRFSEAVEAIDRYLARTDEPFESSSVRQAYELREAAEREQGL